MEPSNFQVLHDVVVFSDARFTGFIMNMIQLRCTAVAGVCLAFLLGCPGGGVAPTKTYPVSGSVAYKGEPVVGAKVTFMAEGSSAPASGITDKEGKFQLSTAAINDGAVAGEHKITVVKEEAANATVDTSAMDDPAKMAQQYNKQKDSEAGLNTSKMTLPVKYASQATTTLKETVKAEGTNRFILQLADD
ncbi:MAG: carboxypeptidase regulatory-like domain-containing protein [Planctomycetaceae bacterium]|nr:carboxypeptidase regulatory-like domain-containing protein [Planctomycetaceae bacterium]